MPSLLELFVLPRRRLVADVKAIYAPFKQSTTQPPFAYDELRVMAFVMLGESSSEASAREWIFNQFVYYRIHGVPSPLPAASGVDLLAKYLQAASLGQTAAVSPPHNTDEFLIFPMANVPLRRSAAAEERGMSTTDRLSSSWNISDIGEVRCYLQKFLLPAKTDPPKKRCYLLELPAEIRSIIYSMVLAYPNSGVCITKPARKTIPFVISHDVDDEWAPKKWHVKKGTERLEADDLPRGLLLRCPPLKTHLALLGVNRKIRSEARSMFYGMNKFVCTTRRELDCLLGGDRRLLVRHVAFEIGFQQHEVMEAHEIRTKVFDGLVGLHTDCQVHLLASDTKWQTVDWYDVTLRMFRADRANRPGLPFKWDGDCPKLQYVPQRTPVSMADLLTSN